MELYGGVSVGVINFVYLEGGQQFHTFFLVREVEFDSTGFSIARLRLWLYGSVEAPILVLDTDTTSVESRLLGQALMNDYAIAGLGNGRWSIAFGNRPLNSPAPGGNTPYVDLVVIKGDLSGVTSINQYSMPSVNSPVPLNADVIDSENFVSNVNYPESYASTNGLGIHGRGGIYFGATQWKVNRGEFVNEGVDAYGQGLHWWVLDGLEEGPFVDDAEPRVFFINPTGSPLYKRFSEPFQLPFVGANDPSIIATVYQLNSNNQSLVNRFSTSPVSASANVLLNNWKTASNGATFAQRALSYSSLVGNLLYILPYSSSLISGGPYTQNIFTSATAFDGNPTQDVASVPNDRLIINTLPSGISKPSLVSAIIYPVTGFIVGQ